LWSVRLLRFLIVGGVNTVFGYAAFAFTYAVLDIWYPVAAFISTVAGILFNFFTTGRLVFANRDNRLVVRFFATYGVLYVIGVGELKAGLLLGVDPLITGAVFVLPNALLGYVLNKRFVFERRPPAGEGA